MRDALGVKIGLEAVTQIDEAVKVLVAAGMRPGLIRAVVNAALDEALASKEALNDPR